MKTLKHLFTLTLITVFALSCKNEAKPEIKTVDVEAEAITEKTLDPNATYAKAELTIEGMTCQIGCANTIQKKIAKMEGVKSAKVDFDRKLAMVEYNDAKVTPTSLKEAIAKVSDAYKVTETKTVDAFSKKECKADCAKACCANKTEAEKKACAADCKKACCTKKEAA